MIKSYFVGEYNMVVIEFAGRVDAAQAEVLQPEVIKIVPAEKGFRLLTDFTLLEEMSLDVLQTIKKSMDFFNERGVAEIIRVIPRPEQDYGFNIMSIFHYSKSVRMVVLKSRAEADARLKSLSR